MKLPGRAWIAIHRVQNRWHDLLAVLSGYCNDRPQKTGVPREGGGYRNWRCALKRRHDGMHRTGNYVWEADGKVTYLPAPHGSGKEAHQPWRRDMTPTMRQARNRRHWDEEQSRLVGAGLQEEGLL
ncbi:hypothetical protein ABIE67_007885 [Streptomyces sp. V4I8]|uniref:hypothetical protein n=1 Tax=Streptomyces sp. V4I8 TaxID=3156469 RepID=UPI0035197AD3